MKLSEIQDVLDAEILAGHDQLDTVLFGGGSADLMDDVLAAVAKGAVLLTGLTTVQVIRTAKIAGVGAIVFVRGKKPEDAALELAKNYNMPILLTECSLFTASGLLYVSGLRGINGSW